MAILLVRHGETPSNAARVVQVPDAPLSERGRAQAALLAARLSKLDVAQIVASDYARALDTAEQVRAATNAPLEIWPGLRERDFGEPPSITTPSFASTSSGSKNLSMPPS